jgi:small-conductance mechanosensitive channel
MLPTIILPIVPNSDFITHTVINWSHGDVRVDGGCQWSGLWHESRTAGTPFLEVALAHPKVLRDPAPSVFFLVWRQRLQFELAVWTTEMTFQPRRFRSELYFAIEAKLSENQIQIPFPQRDLHLKSGNFVLQSALAAGRSGSGAQ